MSGLSRLVVGVALMLASARSAEAAATFLGSFAAIESTVATTVTSGNRTSTAGSLVVGVGGSFDSAGTQNNVITDNKSNTFTERVELGFGTSSESHIVLSYNIGGTRGATHTITNTKTGGSASTTITVGGGEFSGVAAVPTIVSNTATGSSTTPSVAVSAASSSLFIGLTAYDTGGPSTITENTGGGWALMVEGDENNDAQDFNAQYKAGLTGSQTASWTISNTGTWGAVIVAFTEAGGAGCPTTLALLGVGC